MSLLPYSHYKIYKWCTDDFKNCKSYDINELSKYKYIIIKIIYDDERNIISDEIRQILNNNNITENCHYLLQYKNNSYTGGCTGVDLNMIFNDFLDIIDNIEIVKNINISHIIRFNILKTNIFDLKKYVET